MSVANCDVYSSSYAHPSIVDRLRDLLPKTSVVANITTRHNPTTKSISTNYVSTAEPNSARAVFVFIITSSLRMVTIIWASRSGVSSLADPSISAR